MSIRHLRHGFNRADQTGTARMHDFIDRLALTSLRSSILILISLVPVQFVPDLPASCRLESGWVGCSDAEGTQGTERVGWGEMGQADSNMDI